MGKDFVLEHQINFDRLLQSYAKAKQVDKNQKRLIENDGTFYRGRTIGCLVDESNKFIKGLGIIRAEADMVSFTSKRQIRLLGQALSGKNKRISGYSMILLHCIFDEIRTCHQPDFELLKDCAKVIQELVSTYYEYYPEDEIARFLLRCYSKVLDELENPSRRKTKNDFPGIPKHCADDTVE